MTARRLRPKERIDSDVALALEAIEGRPNPLDDPEMNKVDPDLSSLDLPEGDGFTARRDERRMPQPNP